MTQPPLPPASGSPEPGPQPYSAQPQPVPGGQSGFPQATGAQPGYPGAAGPQPGFAGAPAPLPPKKSKVGKIIAIVLAVVVLLCAAGSAVAFFALKDDVEEAVDASKTRLVTPQTLGGRPKITDAEIQAAADGLLAEMKKGMPDATSTVGAFYGDPEKQDMVMIAGASGLIADPAKELEDAISGMATGGGVQTSSFTAVDAGPLGGTAKCGDAEANGVDLGVCVWADRGSLGMIMLYFKTADEAKAEFLKIRSEIQQRI